MEQQGPTSDSNGNNTGSVNDFGWEDFTVNPGHYNVPKASDIQGDSGTSFKVVEDSSTNGGLGWEDYTTKTDRNDIIESIDNADGQGSIFTLSDDHPMTGVEDSQDSKSPQDNYRVVIRNSYLTERFRLDEETLKQKCQKIGGSVLNIGMRAVLPNYVTDLTALGTNSPKE